MIRTKEDYLYFLEQDRIALGVSTRGVRNRLRNALFPDPIWKFQRIMRKLEYSTNVKGGGFFGSGIAGDTAGFPFGLAFRFRSTFSVPACPSHITDPLSSIRPARLVRTVGCMLASISEPVGDRPLLRESVIMFISDPVRCCSAISY